MHLQAIELATADAPLPPRVAAFLESANARIDEWFDRPDHQPGIGFIPSNYVGVFAALAAIRSEYPDLRRLLEWGSGFGAVAGMAALLGMDVAGIEIDDELIPTAQELLAEHDLHAEFVHGSFVPADFDDDEHIDHETRTVFGEDDAYGDLGRDVDDFDVVFAYPWPTEEDLYREMFRRHGDYGAILLTWSNVEGARAYRKVAGAE